MGGVFSMTTKDETLRIVRGETFTQVFRWEARPYVYKAITAISKTAPVQITATGHGMVDGWRANVVSAGGMTEINATYNPITDSGEKKFRNEMQVVTYVDANTVQFNRVNSSGYTTYTSGGYLQYLTPVDMTGHKARATIKDREGGTAAVTLTTENGGITVNNTTKTITLTVSAAATAAMTIDEGVYDLEMISSDGVVTKLVAIDEDDPVNVTVTGEITT